MKTWSLVWIIAFVIALFSFRGSEYFAFVMLFMISLSTPIALALAKVKRYVNLAVSLGLIGWLCVASYLWGVKQSTLDPTYLPIVFGVILIYGYSWWRVRKGWIN